MFLRFVGFMIGLITIIAAVNLFAFMMIGFIDTRLLSFNYTMLTLGSLTFFALYHYLVEYTSFYEKYGIESYRMEKDRKQMSEEAFLEKYNS